MCASYHECKITSKELTNDLISSLCWILISPIRHPTITKERNLHSSSIKWEFPGETHSPTFSSWTTDLPHVCYPLFSRQKNLAECIKLVALVLPQKFHVQPFAFWSNYTSHNFYCTKICLNSQWKMAICASAQLHSWWLFPFPLRRTLAFLSWKFNLLAVTYFHFYSLNFLHTVVRMQKMLRKSTSNFPFRFALTCKGVLCLSTTNCWSFAF